MSDFDRQELHSLTIEQLQARLADLLQQVETHMAEVHRRAKDITVPAPLAKEFTPSRESN